MPTQSHRFPSSRRLHGRLAFAAVRAAALKDSRGPLTIRGLPNDLGYCRLGISIGRVCGTAVRRNRIKRLLREAFRLLQHDLPAGYDLVISVRPHAPLILAEYQRLLSAGLVKIHTAAAKLPAKRLQ